MRHAIFTHGNFDFHARVIYLAQHFFDATDRLTVQAWRLCELDNNHLSHRSFGGRTFVDQHILAVALVFWRDQPDAAFLQQATDDGLLGAFQNFNHAPLWTPLAI